MYGPHTSASRIEALRNVVRILRSPYGCPWDREQTIASLKHALLEEASEAADAIDQNDHEHIQEELGDVLLIVFLMSQIAEGDGQFTIEDVLQTLYEKLVRRHPHVFGTEFAETSDSVRTRWEEIKTNLEGRAQTDTSSKLDAVPRNLSPLLRAEKLQKKAAKAGFDWPSRSGPLGKLTEEVQELTKELSDESTIDSGRVTDELGDIMFSAINVGRHLGISADDALRSVNRKFERRFRHVEQEMSRAGVSMSSSEIERMEVYWQESKAIPKDPD